MSNKSNKVVVLTGATGVIGQVLAKRFAAQSDVVLVLVVRDLEKGEKLKASLLAENPSAHIELEIVDLLSNASISEFVTRLTSAHKSVDVLINNAGAHYRQKTLTSSGVEATVQVNVIAPILLAHLLKPNMRRKNKKNPSHVIHMSTTVADDFDIHDAFFDERSYNGVRSFKQANGMLRALSSYTGTRAADDGIVVNSIHPGTITSPLLSIAGFTRGLNTSEEIANNVFKALAGGIETAGAYYRDADILPCEFSFNDDLSKALLNKINLWVGEKDVSIYGGN